MNLNDYFIKYRVAHITHVAHQAGTSIGYLRGCKYGQRQMSADLAIWLEHVTSGELTAHELRPDLPWPGTTSTEPTPTASLPEVA